MSGATSDWTEPPARFQAGTTRVFGCASNLLLFSPTTKTMNFFKDSHCLSIAFMFIYWPSQCSRPFQQALCLLINLQWQCMNQSVLRVAFFMTHNRFAMAVHEPVNVFVQAAGRLVFFNFGQVSGFERWTQSSETRITSPPLF